MWVPFAPAGASGLALSPALLLALLLPQAVAQLTNLPNLANTGTTSTGTSAGRSTQTTQATAQTQGATDHTSTGTTMATTSPASKLTNAPTLATGTAAQLTDLPTIAGASIPIQTVPYTLNAPFMQKSRLPEGTVFICVGAILGVLGAAILAWRGLVAWSLHRSVQRTAYSSQQKNEKATLHKPRPNRVSRAASSGPAHGHSMSMDHVSKPFAGGSRPGSYVDGHKPPNPRDSNLFFSPTAGAGVHAHAHGLDRRPASSYMPSGFYASSSVHLPSTTQLNGQPSLSGSQTHLPPTGARPVSSSAGYPRSHSYAPSPPGTPPHRATDLGYPRTANSSVVGGVGSAIESASTLNLNAPGGSATGGRAPSAYLEDLFDHGNGPREMY